MSNDGSLEVYFCHFCHLRLRMPAFFPPLPLSSFHSRLHQLTVRPTQLKARRDDSRSDHARLNYVRLPEQVTILVEASIVFSRRTRMPS